MTLMAHHDQETEKGTNLKIRHYTKETEKSTDTTNHPGDGYCGAGPRTTCTNASGRIHLAKAARTSSAVKEA